MESRGAHEAIKGVESRRQKADPRKDLPRAACAHDGTSVSKSVSWVGHFVSAVLISCDRLVLPG